MPQPVRWLADGTPLPLVALVLLLVARREVADAVVEPLYEEPHGVGQHVRRLPVAVAVGQHLEDAETRGLVAHARKTRYLAQLLTI